MKRGYWIILSNQGGELDREFTHEEDQIKDVLIALVRNCEAFYPGDVITVTEGESEIE